MSNETNPETHYPQADYWAPKRPDWSVWQKKHQAVLWQAVVLACNLDPSSFQMPGSDSLVRQWNELPQQAEDLLVAAKGSIGANGALKVVSNSLRGLEESIVDLSNFTAWLQSMQYTLPAEFLWTPEALELDSIHWPWGRHSTGLLRKLAAAADKFWKNYDPEDPSTAPTNVVVSSWLEEQGVAHRNATAMATILRADGLRTGPR